MAVGTYVPAPSSNESWEGAAPPVHQTSFQRFSRKFKEEPLVPIGILATVVALGGATSALQKGNRVQFNKFLRYRVAAQGATVIFALLGSVYYQKSRREVRSAERASKGLPAEV